MVTRKSKAYEYIRSRILSSEIKPGALITELDLSEKLNMSRTPIREAIRDLEAEGLVKSYPARGTVVTTLTKSDVEEIYELRVLLEVWALEKGFDFIRDTELDYLEKQFVEAYQNSDWERLHKADREFHKLITEKANSIRLIVFLNALNSQIERIRRISAQDSDRIEASYFEHLEIIKQIRSHNLAGAIATLREHLRSVSNSAIRTAILVESTSLGELVV